MRPTGILMDEHRVIEQVLDCLDAMAGRCAREGRLDAEAATQAIDFFRAFADRCHHAKEEDLLFPLMESRGFRPDAGPTAVMRAEHVQGRSLVAAMEAAVPGAAAGGAADLESWQRAARHYSALLREHIQKEDHCLFPMAERGLLPADMAELERRFDAVERVEIGPGVHERYLRLADALAERFGVAKCGALSGARQGGCCGHA